MREAVRQRGERKVDDSFLYDKRQPSLLRRVFFWRKNLVEKLGTERRTGEALQEVFGIAEVTGDATQDVKKKVDYAAVAAVENIGFESCSIEIGSNGSREAVAAYRKGGELSNEPFKDEKDFIDSIAVEIRGNGKHPGDVIGRLVFGTSQKKPFSNRARTIAERLARQLGIGISHAMALMQAAHINAMLQHQIDASMGMLPIPKALENSNQVTKAAYRFLDVARKAFNGKKRHIEGLFVFKVEKDSLKTVLAMDIDNNVLVEPGERWVGLAENGTLPSAVRQASARKSNMVMGIWNNGKREAFEFDPTGKCKSLGSEGCDVPGFVKALSIPESEKNGLVVIDFVYLNEKGEAEDVFAFYMKDGTVDGTAITCHDEVIVGEEKLRDLLDVCRFGGKTVADAIKLEEAGIDGVTGLLVHKRGIADTDKMISRWKRNAETMSVPVVLMLDLDKFKNVNDGKADAEGNVHEEGAEVEGRKLGHQVGDQVLRIVGERMTKVLRDEDVFFRYGGEEFVAGLENCENPEKVAERLRRSIAEPMPVKLDDGSEISIRVTASMGIAPVDEADAFSDIEGARTKAIGKADNALYEAKRNGRNMCVAWTPDGFVAVEPQNESAVLS